MLSFRVSLALRLKAFPLNHKLPRPQLLRITPTRNPSQISNLHTLQHHVSASHAQSIACALFQKHRGVYPQTPTQECFLRGESDFQQVTASETGSATTHPPTQAQSPTRTSTASRAMSTHKTTPRSTPESHTADSETPCS